MSLQCSVRTLLWSDLCGSDLQAYTKYLDACVRCIQDGCSSVKSCSVDGSSKSSVGVCGCIDHGVGAFTSCDSYGVVKEDAMVGGVDSRSVVVDTQNNGDGGAESASFGVGCCGLSVGGVGGKCGCVLNGRVVSGVSETTDNDSYAKADGWSVGQTWVSQVNRGKHFAKNKKKRDAAKKKRMQGSWRKPVDGSGGCVSDASETCTVKTTDTRTEEEIALSKSLAARRIAENNVARKAAEHKYKLLCDTDRTEAIARLSAAKFEQRINDAKAKSQASFKKCDESLKSLGSAGSAGELALKQEVKKAKDNEKIHKYVQAQADFLVSRATPETLRELAEMPPPDLSDAFDDFGDCPSDYNEEEAEAYYEDLNRCNAENYDRTCMYF